MLLVKTLIFAAIAPGTFLIFLPYVFLSRGLELSRFDLGLLKFVGIIPIILGIIAYLWCVLNFALIGRGTPVIFDPPKKFVSQGFYKIVRNPMYIAVGSVLVGEAILFGSLILFAYALLMWSLINLFVILYEEPNLRTKFGKEYEKYCQKVPRWIPKLEELKVELKT